MKHFNNKIFAISALAVGILGTHEEAAGTLQDLKNEAAAKTAKEIKMTANVRVKITANFEGLRDVELLNDEGEWNDDAEGKATLGGRAHPILAAEIITGNAEFGDDGTITITKDRKGAELEENLKLKFKVKISANDYTARALTPDGLVLKETSEDVEYKFKWEKVGEIPANARAETYGEVGMKIEFKGQ